MASSQHSTTLSNGSACPVNIFNGIDPMVLETKKFKAWAQALDTNTLDIKNIDLHYAAYFGRTGVNTLGFVLADVKSADRRNDVKFVPGISFVRGPAVAVQIIVDCDDGKKYVVVCRQMRVPVGCDCYEIPAGMVDADEKFSSAIFRETKEETGIELPSVSDFKSLGGFWPSPGGCDEKIELYATRIAITRSKMDEIQKGVHGKLGENEHINIMFVRCRDYPKFLYTMGDCKAEIAYRRTVDQGIFPLEEDEEEDENHHPIHTVTPTKRDIMDTENAPDRTSPATERQMALNATYNDARAEVGRMETILGEIRAMAADARAHQHPPSAEIEPCETDSDFDVIIKRAIQQSHGRIQGLREKIAAVAGGIEFVPENMHIFNKMIDMLPRGVSNLISDGHHTFDQLYEVRCALTAGLWNMAHKKAGLTAYKSRRHSDGEPCFGGRFFIVVMHDEEERSMSFHYKLDMWDHFDIPERELAEEWDGYTTSTVIKRLFNLKDKMRCE